MKNALLLAASGLFLMACVRGEVPEAGAPAYMPEQVRQARAQAAEQAEILAGLVQSSEWTILDISGQAMLAQAEPTLVFSGGNAVSGSTGCNMFNGSVSLDAAQLSFGPLVTTRKLCPEPVMEQERFVLDTLGQVISAGVNEDSTLFLSTLNGDVIRLARGGG